MIIDCHTHVWTYPGHLSETFVQEANLMRKTPVNMNIDLADHWKAMSPVDRAFVFAVKFRHTGAVVPNDYVANYVKQHPEKLIGVASVDPTEEGAVEELERAVQDLGMKALKLSSIYQNFHPCDERAMAVYEKACQLRIPLIVHQATTFPRNAPLKYADPTLMEDVALRFPDLKIVLAHLGHPWEREAIVLVRKQPNVFADLSALYYRSWQFYNSMLLCVEYGVTHKLLFGSDYPVTTPQESIDNLHRVNRHVIDTPLPKVPKDVIEEIIHRDTLSVLEIEA